MTRIEELSAIECAEGTLRRFRMTNAEGAYVELCNVGAGITSVVVPDREGAMADVLLGYDDPRDYVGDGPCMGKIPGRYANRIAAGRFTLDGVAYEVPVNCGPNHLHGGPDGFANQLWTASIEGESVVFSLHSADGHAGFPSALDVVAKYMWNDDNCLMLNISATTDGATVLNLTNHAYWNLSGHDTGSALDHHLRLWASRWLPTDPSLVPTGELQAVAGTPMDFTMPQVIGSRIEADFDALRYGKGYDNCWVIDGAENVMRRAAELYDPKSGRVMTVATDQPAVQVYTGNWLDDSPMGKGAYKYHDYAGVAIECQNFPDAPNHPSFPTSVLRRGERYDRTISFAFSVR